VILQRLSWSLVKLARHGVQLGLAVHGQVGALDLRALLKTASEDGMVEVQITLAAGPGFEPTHTSLISPGPRLAKAT